MNKVIHRADDRGYADHGWLKARHSFSFAGYHDESKIHFGLLRVLNDDSIAAGRGFGAHPHDNMEIVTIPLSGAVKHQDSIGNQGVIKVGEVQVMSAGSGITHAEFNASTTEPLNLFQIWVFPKLRNIAPRYGQKAFPVEGREGKFQLLVAPDNADGALSLNQDVWFSLGKFKAGEKVNYSTHRKENGMYLMVVEGEVEIAGETLKKRDAIGISASEKNEIIMNQDSELLIIDVPMN
jgi:quercetin 2,3-dioxygenase